jgi:hypothetical protein
MATLLGRSTTGTRRQRLGGKWLRWSGVRERARQRRERRGASRALFGPAKVHL